jgi:hypothetical protein
MKRKWKREGGIGKNREKEHVIKRERIPNLHHH